MRYPWSNEIAKPKVVFSALPDERAAKILRLIAAPSENEITNKRSFEEVDDGQWYGFVNINRETRRPKKLLSVPVALVLGPVAPGVCEYCHIHLSDVAGCSKWSAKPISQQGSSIVLGIGDTVPERFFFRIANTIVGCWVINLEPEESCMAPYGVKPSNKKPNKRGSHYKVLDASRKAPQIA